MIKKSVISMCSVLALSACQSTPTEKFDTVSIRHKDISCTENIRSINNGTAGFSYQSSDSALRLNLQGPVPIPGNEFNWDNPPCRELLKDIEEISRAQKSLELEKIKLEKLRVKEEIRSLNGFAHQIDSDF